MRPPIHSLTGVRFFAAAWVVALHFGEITPTHTVKYPIADNFVSKGGLGVDLFFVLSGFILSYVYTETFSRSVRSSDYRTFILFRIGRIYPVHLVTFLFMMLLLGAQLALSGGTAHPERFTSVMVVSTLTMTHAWIPGVVSPNLPSWSISAELFAYLLFPMLIVLIARLRAGAALFIVTGILLATTYESLPFDAPLVRVMAGFLVGMGAFRLGHIEIRGRLQRWGGLIAVALIVCWVVSSAAPRLELGVVLFAALIVLVRSTNDLAGRFLALPALVYLGEVSYSLYMVHWPVRAVLRQAFASVGVADSVHPGLISLSYWVTSILAAIAMYHIIEQPGRRWIRAIAVRSRVSNRVAVAAKPAKVLDS